MSRQPYATGFRRVDVDQFNEEKFRDDEAECSTNGGLSPELGGPCEQYIVDLLAHGEAINALIYVLGMPPVKTKDQARKNQVVQLVMRVLLTFRSVADIEDAVTTLSPAHLDSLMKYIYRGFEFPTPDGSSALLLVWHEKVFAVAGPGCIVRVLTDQKRV